MGFQLQHILIVRDSGNDCQKNCHTGLQTGPVGEEVEFWTGTLTSTRASGKNSEPMNDLNLVNGRIMTMDPINSRCDYVVVRDGLVLAVGRGMPSCDWRTGGVETIDCGGRIVIPGFIDAHCHVASYAESFITLDLSPRSSVRSINDLKEKVAKSSQKLEPGTWIRGKRYNEFYLAERRHPNRWDLDAAAPRHPVRLSHRSGHAHVLNSLALKIVGITAESEDPPRGLIDRDLESGEPTGLLFGMGGLLSKRIPPVPAAEVDRSVALASNQLLAYGITSVCDASSHNDLQQWNQFEEWAEHGLFGPRVTMMIRPEAAERIANFTSAAEEKDRHLRVGPVKVLVDRITGSMRPSQGELNDIVSSAHYRGLQVAIHAVEPAEIEAACEAIEQAVDKYPRADHRHRIEHCSVCPPALLARIRRLGIVVVTQPSFVYYSGDRYAETVSESDKHYLYQIGSMVRRGILVGAGSDFPVVDSNPFFGIYAATTRRTEMGQEILPDEAIEQNAALALYTRSAAAACKEEHLKGSIVAGQYADLVVLDTDLLADSPSTFKGATAFLTVLGGKIVWRCH
jgi:predicted amidohydrolase YtcJ